MAAAGNPQRAAVPPARPRVIPGFIIDVLPKVEHRVSATRFYVSSEDIAHAIEKGVTLGRLPSEWLALGAYLVEADRRRKDSPR